MVGARTVLNKPTLHAFAEAMEDENFLGKDARVVYKWLNRKPEWPPRAVCNLLGLARRMQATELSRCEEQHAPR